MRVLYHHRTLADGAEGIHIAAMVAAFAAFGHEVHVRGLAGGDSAPAALAGRLKRALPSAAFELATTASNMPDYLDIRRAIRELRPDFLYKRHARLDIGALAAARDTGVPSVLEVNCLFTARQYRGFEPMTLGSLAGRLERRALQLADVVVAVSTPLAYEVERFAPVRAIVLPNGVDPERFDPAQTDGAVVRARYGLGQDLTVGWSGVMRDWHGLDLLLDAVSKLDNVRLLLVGDGPARASVEAGAAARGFSKRLVITGRVPQESMPQHLAAMDVAVVAHDGTGVASPMKLLEYMAMERAVVAPRLDNIRDLLTDERDGLLFEPGSADSLEQTIRRLTADSGLRAVLGRRARQTVQQSRNWRSNARRVLTLVEPHIAALAPRNLARSSS